MYFQTFETVSMNSVQCSQVAGPLVIVTGFMSEVIVASMMTLRYSLSYIYT